MSGLSKLLPIALAAMAFTTAACGDDAGDEVPGAAPVAAAEPAGESGLAAFDAKVDELVASSTAKQTDNKPPTKGPAPAKGKSIYVIPCAQVAEGCARPARGAVEAAKALGWKATLIDPAGDPSKTADAIQQAIAAGADGLVLAGGADASLYKGPLRAAEKAGVAVSCFACINEEELIDDQIPPEESYVDAGYAVAAAAYKQAGGELKMAMLIDDAAGVVRKQVEGTRKFVDECKAAQGKCELVAEQKYALAGLTTTVPKLAVSVLRSHPDANVFWVGYDAGLTFMQPALNQAGLTRKSTFGVGFNGDTQSIEKIRKGDFQQLTLGNALEWMGYGEVDNLNRIFNGEEPVDQGVRPKLLTKENLPTTGNWSGDIDYAAAYRTLWGL